MSSKHQHSKHQHRATGESKTYGWSHCVVHGSCSGRSHGGVTFIDTCGCGATRRTESNGGGVGRGPWIEPDEQAVQQ